MIRLTSPPQEMPPSRWIVLTGGVALFTATATAAAADLPQEEAFANRELPKISASFTKEEKAIRCV